MIRPILTACLVLLGLTVQAQTLQLTPNAYDFGTVEGGKPVNTTLELANTGTNTLVISKISPSCGCTTVGNWEHNLAPGEKQTVNIHFDSTQYNGHVDKLVTIESNDPQHRFTYFKLTGKVHQAMTFQPPYLLLHPDAKQEADGQVEIINQRDTPLNLTNIYPGNPAFSITLVTNVPGQHYTLKIHAQPPYTGGLQTMVRVFTDDGKNGHFLAIINQPTPH